MADTVGERAGSVILVVLGLVGVFAIGAIIARICGILVEMVWPLFLAGGVGVVVLVGDYIAGSSRVMGSGGILIGAAIAAALFAYMTDSIES